MPKPPDQLKEAVPEALNFKPRTPSENFLQEHLKDQIQQREIEYYRVLRKELDPERILKHFEKTHGLVRDNYTTFRAKDGSARIKIGSIAFNVSDFSTKHMQQSWEDTKIVLNETYREQRAEKEDKHLINAIAFASRYATQGYTGKEKLLRLEESISILKYLQQQEKYGEKAMPLEDLEKFRVKGDLLDSNSISNAEISLLKTADNFKRQQAIAKQLSFKMRDIVPARDIKNKRVDFKDKTSGKEVFRDVGDKLIMSKRQPELDHVAAAMTLAAEKFGSLNITGTRAFKQQVIDVAIAKNLNVVFDSPKMQEAFMNQKEAHIQKASLVKNISANKDQTVNKREDNIESNPSKNEPITLVSFGSAPYLNDKKNKESYHATLSNGETLWGVGLKSAISESGAKIGDEVSINKIGTETVKVNVDIKDEKGNVVSSEEKEVERGSWKVDVKNAVVEEVEKVSNTDVSKTKTFDVDYKWIKDERKMGVTINGKQPDYVPSDVLEKIIKNDSFLINYSLEAVKSGQLDLGVANNKFIRNYSLEEVKAGKLDSSMTDNRTFKNYSLEDVESGKLDLGSANDIQPVPRQFNEDGEVVQKQEETKSIKLKM